MPEQTQEFWNTFNEFLNDFNDQALDVASSALDEVERLATKYKENNRYDF